MRKRYIQDPNPPYKLIPAEEYQAPEPSGPFVLGDLQPYQSMVTGEMIEGRRQHREHLKAHNVVEVGNSFDSATPKPVYQPGRLKETIARQVYEKLRY
jgi:hypothetical protein